MKTVFVSYSQPDEKIGLSLVQHLKQEGFIVWFAAEQFQSGDSFAEIFDQIGRCDIFLVLLSRNSIKSKWVKKEIDVAISNQLNNGRLLRLIPVYLESINYLSEVVDLKSINLREGHWDEDIKTLVKNLQGLDKDGPLSTQSFEDFLSSLVLLDNTIFKKLKAFFYQTQPPRALDELEQLLKKSEISEQDVAHILEAAKRGLELPVVNRSHFAELKRFARRADDIIIRLAGDLLKLKGMKGITLEWLTEWLTTDFLHKHSYIEDAFIEDESLLRWKTESLIEEARSYGLLLRSTEIPRGYAALDAEQNPSYDLGPMVEIAGRLVAAFITEWQPLLT